MQVYYYKRQYRFMLDTLDKGLFRRLKVKKTYKKELEELNKWFENQKKVDRNNFLERIK